MGNVCGKPQLSPRPEGGVVGIPEDGHHPTIPRPFPPRPINLPVAPAQPGGGQNTPTTTTTNSSGRAGGANGNGNAAAHSDVQQPAAPAAANGGDYGDHTSMPRADDDTFPADMTVMPTGPFAWQCGRQIGQGAFGTVYMGLVHATGQEIAVKQVALPRDSANSGKVSEHIRSLESEVAVLRGLRHENIVRYLGTERTNEHLNIFLEYVAGGPISSKLAQFGPLREETIRVYTKQILRGLEYLHKQKVMHRDIKGANILVDSNGVVKLADFGASKKIEDLATIGGGSRSIRGTAHWMAPEVIKQSGHGRAADIWSLGCVVIEMATGRAPWANFNDPYAVMYHVAATKELPAMPGSLSPAAKDFLTLCFNRVPRERPNATRLLQHPWLCSVQVPRAVPTNPLPMMFPAPPSAATTNIYPAAGAGPSQPQLQPQQQKHCPLLPQSAQHHQHLPPDLRSPPSPIKEECDSRYNSPMGGGTNVSTPSTARTAVLNAANSIVSPPHRTPGSAARPPMVPPLPLNLLNGAQQPTVPKPAAPLPQHKAQQPAVPKPTAPPAPAPQQQQQYDTLVDPDTVRLQVAQVQAAQQRPAAPQPAPAPQPPTMHQPAPGVHDSICMGEGMTISMGPMGGYDHVHQYQEYQSHMGGGSSAACRASTMTLSGYNPIEEPSWMPQPHDPAQRAFFQQLAAVAEHSAPASPAGSSGGAPASTAVGAAPARAVGSSDGSGTNMPDAVPVAIPHADTTSKLPLAAHMALAEAAAASPRNGNGTQRGSARTRTVPTRPALAGVFNTNNDTAADTHVEPDQPSPAATGPSPGGMNKQAVNNTARPRVSASRRALEEAGILGGTLDPARAKLWRDELVAELEAERMRAAGGNAARESVAPVRPSVADL
ncbi:hypothetical protein HYH02_005472 [Chlamydomonas schloesseri]|uniref:Protein kinase domain-containing protein n=1 Tax=Chlamydomonas schloesseri TaxID=2026947 RepID=A0A836B6T2_9CHLO|nr:hypothetical protein HYH02_005472 [Chlamydomonas schloesseri]|eukprot:KAG2449317.1 hypothetical protein HYH02_005472 [Chlamydomonas schloesseri]